MERGSHGERLRQHSVYRDIRAAPMEELAWAPRQQSGPQAIPPYYSSSEITERSSQVLPPLHPTIRPLAGNNLGRRPIGRANANALAAKG